MPAYTGQQIINSALINLGLLEQGGTPSSSDSDDALTKLNMLLAEWRIQELLIWQIGIAGPFALVANQVSYQIGPAGADFNTTRPQWIHRAVLTLAGPNASNLIEHDVRVTSMSEDYESIPDKKAAGAIPELLYNDRGSPISTLYPWPVPRCATATALKLYTWSQLTDYATLGTSANLPDGYGMGLSYNLAVILAPSYGAAVQGDVMKTCAAIAAETKEQIRKLNAKARNLMMDTPGKQAAA